jgi:serine/threonine protein kinase
MGPGLRSNSQNNTKESCIKVFWVNFLDFFLHSSHYLPYSLLASSYTANKPLLKDIQRELKVMLEVNGVSGVVQTFGHFMDTVDGIIPDKTFKERYLVIVMELLEGGHMLTRVNSQKYVSEHYIALAFKRLIIALDSLHRKHFIHRDIKLENIMFLDPTDFSPIKIIDLGMMVHCPLAPSLKRHSITGSTAEELNYNFIFQDKKCRGTPGYLAPESISSFQYSPKSDLWQAGCVLYSLLSGMPAFNPNIPEQVTDMTYFPMRGQAWDNVSDLGKDLVSKILRKDPKRRLSSAEILDHPWVQGHAPNTSLGDEYLSRIKHLVLRQRLKAFFVDNQIEKNSKARRQHLEEVLPFLTRYSGVKTRESPTTGSDGRQSVHSTEHVEAMNLQMDSPDKRLHSLTPLSPPDSADVSRGGSPALPFTPEKEFRDKLRALKIEVIRSVSLVDRTAGGLALDGDDEEVAEVNRRATAGGIAPGRGGGESASPVRTSGLRVRHINYEVFVSILHRCELPELANRQVFHIFDWKGLGTIDMKEFLMTMLAFQPLTDIHFPLDEQSGASGGGHENSFDDSKESGDGGLHERFSGGSGGGTGGGPYTVRGWFKKKTDVDEEAFLYFKMFDVYERGYLSLEDLRIGIECILYDATEEAATGEDGGGGGRELGINIEALFDAIDEKKTGRIEFKEFIVFYRNLLTQTTGTGRTRIRSRSRSVDPSQRHPSSAIEAIPSPRSRDV